MRIPKMKTYFSHESVEQLNFVVFQYRFSTNTYLILLILFNLNQFSEYFATCIRSKLFKFSFLIYLCSVPNTIRYTYTDKVPINFVNMLECPVFYECN